MKTKIIIEADMSSEQIISLTEDILAYKQEFDMTVRIIKNYEKQDCEHYFSKNSDLTVNPCEICGEEYEDD
jgi:hypothetical protein